MKQEPAQAAQWPEDAAQSVAGERGIPSVNRARSLQSKLSNALAMGLMGSIGLGLLTWYFANVSARHARTQASAQSSGVEKAQSEMLLPPLGSVGAPRAAVIERVLGPAPTLPATEDEDEQEERAVLPRGPRTAMATQAASPQALAQRRRLSGPVFMAVAERAPASATAIPAASSSTDEELGGVENLEGWLAPTVTPAALAGVLPSSRLLLPKGAFVDCTLETALDSTLPGMATCVTASDTFSVDGSVVLLERGTKLVGETRGSMRQGQARIFVLWTQARTPEGVVVELASPGTDELGRAGLPGEVDRHFFERFGAALLISLIDGVVQAAVQSSMDGPTVIFNPSTSQDILTEVLRSTVNIPPTVRKHQGDRIQVLVARDLDFRPVYRLRAARREESAHDPARE